MRIQVRDVRRLTLRTIPRFMVLIFFMSAVSLLFTQPTQALSLKKTVRTLTSPVKTLIGPVVTSPEPDAPSSPRPSAPEPSRQSPSASRVSPTSPAPSATSQQPGDVSSPTGASRVLKGEGLEVDDSLRPMQALDGEILLKPAATTKLAGARTTGATAVASNFGILQATENGWRLLGVLWYWWAAFIAMIASLTIWRKRIVQGMLLGRQKFLQKV